MSCYLWKFMLMIKTMMMTTIEVLLTSAINHATRAPNITASLASRSCQGIPMPANFQSSCLKASSFHAAELISNKTTFG